MVPLLQCVLLGLGLLCFFAGPALATSSSNIVGVLYDNQGLYNAIASFNNDGSVSKLVTVCPSYGLIAVDLARNEIVAQNADCLDSCSLDYYNISSLQFTKRAPRAVKQGYVTMKYYSMSKGVVGVRWNSPDTEYLVVDLGGNPLISLPQDTLPTSINDAVDDVNNMYYLQLALKPVTGSSPTCLSYAINMENKQVLKQIKQANCTSSSVTRMISMVANPSKQGTLYYIVEGSNRDVSFYSFDFGTATSALLLSITEQVHGLGFAWPDSAVFNPVTQQFWMQFYVGNELNDWVIVDVSGSVPRAFKAPQPANQHIVVGATIYSTP